MKRVVDNKFEVGQLPLIRQELKVSGRVREQARLVGEEKVTVCKCLATTLKHIN